MPNLRIMNWNIEVLSWTKINVPGMAAAIARTIVSQDIDIVIIVEVRLTRVYRVMSLLSAALNNEAVAINPLRVNDYKGFFLSYSTGSERYGFIVKDLDTIRPVGLVAGNGQDGSANYPVSNLKKNSWTVWPSNDWTTTAYPVQAGRPMIPLVDLYAVSPRRNNPARFRGQAQGNGPNGGSGYSLGRGFRMPCLAMFMVHTAAGEYLLPIVCCHYAAVRSGRNFLGQGQVNQLMFLHICQMFDDTVAVLAGGPHSHFIEVDGNAVRVEELFFTGDFNMDFLENDPNGTNIQMTNHSSYRALTPTLEQGGSAAPAALPAPPEAPVPAVPYTPPFSNGPLTNTINQQQLKAAVTTQGTILKKYNAGVVPASTDALKGAAFDNFLYGGTVASTAAINFGTGGVDAGDVIDVPANIVQTGGVANNSDIDVSGVAAYYAARTKKKAHLAPSLQANQAVGPALTVNDRLIGARLISDHLPVIIDFICP
ncbi:exonuclease/endonuclease/phosphatase family protein [Paenibacillus tuaregi]|uniref:hypothetical protein n=1 Tax=Paenibacillus tuaregi TaxID=1816681 RepID=UPI000838BAFB|nr:hypothetical protein [Paenibacillus tuaregi]